MNCTECGNELSENSLFCPNCGSEVQAATPQENICEQPEEQQATSTEYIKNKKRKKQITLGVSAFLLVAVLVTTIILLISCSSNADNSSPTGVITSFFTAFSENDSDTFMDTMYPPIIEKYSSLGFDNDQIFLSFKNKYFDDDSFTRPDKIIFTENQELEQGKADVLNVLYAKSDGYKKISSLHQIKGSVNTYANNTAYVLSFDATIALCGNKYFIFDILIDD